MPDRTRITVCVVALTQSDYNELDPSIQTQLTALTALYDFGTPGKPYAGSPDEWRPFDMGGPIREYLEKANFEASLLSSQLFDSAAAREVLKKTHLYIIDPFVLTHAKKKDRLAGDVQTAIFITEKAFCVILPAELPKALRTEIANKCAAELGDLYGIRDEDDSYEWVVEDAERLNGYLKRLARRLVSKPDPDALAAVQALLGGRGVPSPSLPSPPRLVT
jgi:hypothetical protein